MREATRTELRLARRMADLGTETSFEVLVKARQLESEGRDIVHLEIGEPDFDTPPNIVQAAVDALHRGYTHYGPSAGLPELREAIAEEAGVRRGAIVSPEEVVVVPGGKPVLFFSALALLEPGDEAIYPNPGYPIYESMIRFLGAKPVPLRLCPGTPNSGAPGTPFRPGTPTAGAPGAPFRPSTPTAGAPGTPLREEMDFRLDPKELARLIGPRTKLIILNSPQNPTGAVLTRGDVEEIASIVVRHPCMVLSDEIYSRLIFEGEHHSLLSYPELRDRVILLDGFSKSYAMTGWRLGYGVMRADLARQIARLISNAHSCTTSFIQMAGIEALHGQQDSVAAMREEFRRRRDYFVERINRIPGFRCTAPKGAFYMFPNITGTGWSSKALADALLQEAGVAALSGTAFGDYGEGHLRFSIATSLENIREGLDRVESWAQKNVREGGKRERKAS